MYSSWEEQVRVLLIIGASVAVAAPAGSEPAARVGAASQQSDTTVATRPSSPDSNECRRAQPHLAKAKSVWMGERVPPKKLDELPPGTAYMAVNRTISGCEVPMTAVEYWQSARR